jgi:hypothetical protein
MSLNVTAIYPTHSEAELVRKGLLGIGIASSDIHVVPDRDVPVGTGGYRESSEYTDRLWNLHLPDDDLHIYQHAIRRGDHVVSAEVDEAQHARVKEIMRHPDLKPYEFARRSAEFRDEARIPYGASERPVLHEDWRARPLAAHDDPYARTYERNARLGSPRKRP